MLEIKNLYHQTNYNNHFLPILILLFIIILSSCSNLKTGKIPITPNEDFMREHGLLSRILLTYEESIKRLENNESIPTGTIRNTADIIHEFIENYHEKLEEKYVFPQVEKQQAYAAQVKVLRQQHTMGRTLTENILKYSDEKYIKNPAKRKILIQSMKQYILMYRPHKAREDTVVFPEFREITSTREYNRLSKQFDKREEQLFGENGYKRFLDNVVSLEKQLDIYNLSKFNPNL